MLESLASPAPRQTARAGIRGDHLISAVACVKRVGTIGGSTVALKLHLVSLRMTWLLMRLRLCRKNVPLRLRRMSGLLDLHRHIGRALISKLTFFFEN